LVNENFKENHQTEKWWNSSSSIEIKTKRKIGWKTIWTKNFKGTSSTSSVDESLEEQLRFKIIEFQQLLPDSVNEKNAQITQL
jgi:hypothetical protein